MGGDQGSKKNEQGEIFEEGVIKGTKPDGSDGLNKSVTMIPQPEKAKRNQIDHSKLNKFMETYIIQNYLSKNKENSQDNVFNSLKELEKEELKKLFENKVKDYENNVLKGGNLKLNIENKIYKEISNIIKYENTEEIFKKKIIDEINIIKGDDTKFPIEHLTILLIGRKGVGKTTLIKHILHLNEDDEYYEDFNSQNKNFTTYTSKVVTHLKLVEFKGIGLDTGSDPGLIGNEAVKCIMEEMKKNKEKNYNDFFHCIWYCISGTRFEESEIAVLKKLSEVYSEKVMPVILVYTQSTDDNIADGMKHHAKKIDIDYSFIKVLAKKMNKKEPFGIIKLLNETLSKCTGALKGDMINLMTIAISTYVSKKMKNKILKDEENINKQVIEIFIKTYKEVLTDENFKNFIVNMLGKNLSSFYNEKNRDNYKIKISNKTLNLIKDSDLIKLVSFFIEFYEKKVTEIINPIISEKAKLFIDKQANIEKDNSNMNLENKRCLIGFEKTNEVFFRRNFYYISQKYIMCSIIKKVCVPYFTMYREQLDSIIDYLLKKDNGKNIDIDIRNYLEECFLTKLRKFAKDYNINVKIETLKLNKLLNSINMNLDEEYNCGNLTQKSIELVDDFNIVEENIIKSVIANNDEENWYPFKQIKFNYLDSNMQKSLKQFMGKNMIYQDSFLNLKTDNDEVYNSLKSDIRNDLIKFFESKKYNFVDNICKNFNSNNINIDKIPISNITKSKMFQDIYTNKKRKLKNIIMNKEKKICEIKHLSIVIGGRSGVGKSTLINAMLKENLAKTGVGKIQTIKTDVYSSSKLNFLRLFDTRGIEFKKEYGPEKILSEILNIIEKEKKEIENKKQDNCDDYIQCIWYCISGNAIEQKELDVIKELKNNNYSIPIIVVNTYTKSKEIAEDKKRKLESEFNNDIHFVSVLAKKISDSDNTFGLDELLDETLKVCKDSNKGIIFENIKKISSNTIVKKFKEKHKILKNKITKNIVSKFINEFKNVLNDESLNQYVYNLFENIFVEYMKSEEKENIELNWENKDLLKDITTFNKIMQKYNQYYKRNTNSIINSISNEKAIEYLNMQAKKEKFQFKKCLDHKHINNKEDFIEIIKRFLTDNFYYISQKYIIYRVIIDVIEKIEEYTENKIDEIVNGFFKDNNFFKDIFSKKYEDLEGKINSFKKNGKIYEDNINLKESIDSNRNPIDKEEAAPTINIETKQYIKRDSVVSDIGVPPPPANI